VSGPSPSPGAPRTTSRWTPGERLAGRIPLPEASADAPVVGVLALQGDVLEHLRALRRCGAVAVEVRTAAQLADVDGLIVPGGESTTIGKLLERFELLAPVRERIAAGMPVFGTCAGMILLSDELEQDATQPLIGGLRVRTRRNAYGRQVDSFDTRIEVAGIDGGPVDVSFIRAPRVEKVLDDEVEVLAEVDGYPVVVRQGTLLAAAFHPEVTGDDRLHAAFVAEVRRARDART
jgi:pyridoxal 5'-phosphate synthase pdxT subunit